MWSIPALRPSSADLDLLIKRAARLDDNGLARRRLSRAKAETLRFIEFHEGRCAVCGVPDNNLVVDHDHWSGLIRGLLCNGCNVLEGAERADAMPLFARYRRRHPAAILTYYEAYATVGVAQIVLSLDRRESARERDLVRTAALLVQRLDRLCELNVEMPPPRPRELWDDEYFAGRRVGRWLGKIRSRWEAFAASRPLAEIVADPGLAEMLSLISDMMTVLGDAADRRPPADEPGVGDMAREVKGSCMAVLRNAR
ncbi:endonuclease domain-containing protein [Actinoplanes sp. NPDC049118]|uniref:endonuclease domain-containing protein n=1 Tax=Actinoplanes sp. NPDC049118 TaxID=3155769 RepID=UPI0033FF72EC